MDRLDDSRLRLTALVIGLATVLAAAPAATAAPPVRDEYTLDLPGYGEDRSSSDLSARSESSEAQLNDGVAGEAEAASSPLSSASGLIADGPVLLALALAVATALIVRTRLGGRPSPR